MARLSRGKRQAVLVVLEKILPHLGSDLFEQEVQVRGNRIVAQDGVLGLQQIAQPQQAQGAERQQTQKAA